jgi:hypothetical protein
MASHVPPVGWVLMQRLPCITLNVRSTIICLPKKIADSNSPFIKSHYINLAALMVAQVIDVRQIKPQSYCGAYYIGVTMHVYLLKILATANSEILHLIFLCFN